MEHVQAMPAVAAAAGAASKPGSVDYVVGAAPPESGRGIDTGRGIGMRRLFRVSATVYKGCEHRQPTTLGLPPD